MRIKITMITDKKINTMDPNNINHKKICKIILNKKSFKIVTTINITFKLK